MPSDSNFITGKQILDERYLRKLEVLIAVTRDAVMPYKRILGHMSGTKGYLNKGNSVRTMETYLKEWSLGDFIDLDGDSIGLLQKGIDVLSAEEKRISAWRVPLDSKVLRKFYEENGKEKEGSKDA